MTTSESDLGTRVNGSGKPKAAVAPLGRDRDFYAEKHIEREGVPWTFEPAVPLTQYDVEKSRTNKGRLTEPLRRPLVEEYGVRMEDGHYFKPLVGWRRPDGTIYLVDGNHRLAAALLRDVPTYGCYLIETDDPALVDRIARNWNTSEGARPDTEEIIAQATYLVKDVKWSVAEAARYMGIAKGTLGNRISSNEGYARLPQQVKESGRKLSQEMLMTLNSIPNEHVMHEVAVGVHEHELPAPDLKLLKKQIAMKRTEAEQLAVARAYFDSPELRQRRAETRRGTARPPARPAAGLIRSLSTGEGYLLSYDTPRRLGLTPTDRQTLERLGDSLSARIQAVLRVPDEI